MKNRTKRLYIKILILLFLLIFSPSGCAINGNQPTGQQPVSSESEKTQEFEAAVETLSECFADISSRSQMIFRRNKELPINSNPDSFKMIVLDGITTCENWKTQLAELGHSEDTLALIKITEQYINNQKMFFKYLLAYIEKRKLNDLELSNKYSRLAAENMKAYTPELVRTLNKNHYIFELKDGYVHFESKLQQ